jgi:NAD(P)-dependent dehydrogenase (short-subunit alcohol dehydrogenase family)
MDLQLKDKKALITGGNKGIGLAVAEALATEGVHLILCARDLALLQEEGQKIADTYQVEVDCQYADVTKARDLEKLITHIKNKHHELDIFISNAGQGSEEKIQTAPDVRWQYYWDLHVMAAVRLSRGLTPIMNEGGAILINSSICARQPLGYEPIYNTTKAALSMFSKCLANELIPLGIRVNTVNPGLIMTPDWRNTAAKLGEKEGITADQYLDRLAKQLTPIGRFGTTGELARFFVFLCSPLASYSVGSTYYVDGGWLNVVE